MLSVKRVEPTNRAVSKTAPSTVHGTARAAATAKPATTYH
jgi:hypothetical protein